MNKGLALYKKAKKLIPGGTQLLSKRPELFLPEGWPAYYKKAKGVEVTDLDGNTFIDMSIMGVGACILGYGDPDVDAAVKGAIDLGSMSTLNCPEEVELAELLCTLHPWASMVRFARSGGEAMAMAVRIARAYTRKDKVAFCGYHGWMDWYLAANLETHHALDGHHIQGLEPRGVPHGLKGTAFPFHYNKIHELKGIIDKHGKDVGAIVMEPQRGTPPEPGFLEEVREIASHIGAVLIFDEITTGFRATCGGIHLLHGIEPDIAVFAKSMANGYAIAAVIGREKVMNAAQDTFISSTNWTERIGPVAALSTVRKHRQEDVSKHIQEVGKNVKKIWEREAAGMGLKLQTFGLDSLPEFKLMYDNELSLTTLFTQLMLERGFLAWFQFKPSLAHRNIHIERYGVAVKEVFGILKDAIETDRVDEMLKGPVARRGFYRLT